jgi:hypothetical protein
MLLLTKQVLVDNLSKLRYFFPAISWSLLIWTLSTTTGLPPVRFDFLSPDKLGHLTFYAIETLLLIWGVAKSQEWKESKTYWVLACMLITAAYGTSLEFVQAGIPERSFDYADILANFTGILLGATIYHKTAAKYFILKSSEG